MIFNAIRGKAFREEFAFKNEKGKALAVPAGDYCLALVRGDYVSRARDLRVLRNSIVWNMTAEETQALEYSTLYFTLTYNGTQIASGVLRVN